jgi:hypothetical protein
MIDRKDADAAIDWAIKQAAKDKKDKLLPDSIIDAQLKGTTEAVETMAREEAENIKRAEEIRRLYQRGTMTDEKDEPAEAAPPKARAARNR